jgi:hypothetical protein
MISPTRSRHSYDHRLRDLVRSNGNIEHATRRGVPRSTARGWLNARATRLVALDFADQDHQRLQREVLALRRRVDRFLALLRLMVVRWKASGFSLSGLRFPNPARRLRLLQAIDRVRAVLPLRAVLRIVGLSPSRYHGWKRDLPCGLDDVATCPRSAPHQLTPTECSTIKEMVTSEDYRHVPTGTLALLAQRLGKVFASPSTWYRLVRRFQWRRPQTPSSIRSQSRHQGLPARRNLARRHHLDSTARRQARVPARPYGERNGTEASSWKEAGIAGRKTGRRRQAEVARSGCSGRKPSLFPVAARGVGRHGAVPRRRRGQAASR